MNDFYIYEQLCELSKIAGSYTDGKVLSKKIRECADRVASQLYRVAVIGEFKRGKSSMINALLGTEVLPTAVLPMTAVNTRVTYGKEKKIVINYKDGGSEEATIEQLIDFATKYDEVKRIKASTIKEILVYYPSVFCKNHIEIIDTPGMNDNEEMTKVTLSVLGSIDAAVMVISAIEPLSMTEQDLILNMIKEQGIHHIVFAVTHIDIASDEEEEQDQLINFIKRRISEGLLERARSRFADDEYLLKKAERILSSPDVYGISSVQAIDGFLHDSEEMLRLSRFPHFKNELLSLLTAAQSADIRLNAEDYILQIDKEHEKWMKNERKYLTEKMQSATDCNNKFVRYFAQGDKDFNAQSDRYKKELKGNTCIKALEENDRVYAQIIRDNFIKNLYTVKIESNTHENVKNALINAVKECAAIIDRKDMSAENTIAFKMQELYDIVVNLRPLYIYSEKEKSAPAQLYARSEEWKRQNPFPKFVWVISPIPELSDLTGVNVITHINAAIDASFKSYEEKIKAYPLLWSKMLYEYHSSMLNNKDILNELINDIQAANSQLTVLSVNYEKQRSLLTSMKNTLIQQ